MESADAPSRGFFLYGWLRMSHKQCLFLYLPKQHMKAAAGAEASTAEWHNEIAYDRAQYLLEGDWERRRVVTHNVIRWWYCSGSGIGTSPMIRHVYTYKILYMSSIYRSFWGCISVFICLYWISPVTTIPTTDAFKLSEYGDAFGIFLSCVCGDRLGVSHKPSAAVPVNQSRYFKPKPDLGLNPTRWPLFLNLSKVQTQT